MFKEPLRTPDRHHCETQMIADPLAIIIVNTQVMADPLAIITVKTQVMAAP